jgi:G3E family GTPase
VEKSLDSLGIHAPVTDPASFAKEIASLPELPESSQNHTAHSHGHETEHHHHAEEHHHHGDGHHHHHAKHHFASCEIPLPAFVEKQALEEFLNSLPEEVLRAKGLVVFREDPGEFQIFQKVGQDGPVHFFPIGRHPLIQEPVALFIGPQLPVDFLKARISQLKKRS